MAKIKTHIDVSEIKARCLVFDDGNRFLVIMNGRGKDGNATHEEFRARFPWTASPGRYEQATGCLDSFGDDYDHWFAVAVQDCYDPPIAIVRAADMSQAIDIFVDELDWAHINDRDLEDYRVHMDPALLAQIPESDRWQHEQFSDAVSFNNSGQAYDAEGIVCWEVKLVRIELE